MDHERADLQESATALVRQLAEYTISLKGLEDALLARLAASRGDILEDEALVEGLEETKRTAVEIAQRVVQAKVRRCRGALPVSAATGPAGISYNLLRAAPPPKKTKRRRRRSPSAVRVRCTALWPHAARCSTSSSTHCPP